MHVAGDHMAPSGKPNFLDRCMPKYAACLTKHSWAMALVVGLWFLACLAYFGANPINLESDGASFSVRSGAIPDNFDALRSAQFDTVYDVVNAITKDTVFRQQSLPALGIAAMYEAEEDGGNVFTAKNLEQIRKFEYDIYTFNGYTTKEDGSTKPANGADYCWKSNATTPEVCEPPSGLTSFFFSDISDPNSLVEPEPFTNILNMFYTTTDPMLAGLVRQLISTDFFEEREGKGAKVIRGSFSYGLPLAGYNNHVVQFEEQLEKFDNWALSLYERFNEEFQRDDTTLRTIFIGDGVTTADINAIIFRDGSYASFSVLFIFFWMYLHTQSAFLTFFGVIHIVMSFPGAYLVFSGIIGVQSFNTLNFLGLFVVLGIGADDVFIMLDAWKQSAFMEPAISESVEARLSYSLRRAIKAMTISSFTTAVAFFANASSPIPPIRWFGVFTGLLVVINFILVITWFPAWIVLNTRRQRYGLLACCMPRAKAKARKARKIEATASGNAEAAEPAGKVKELRAIERFFRDKYAPFVFKFRRPLMVFFGTFLLLGLVSAFFLKPATDTSGFLSPDTNLQRGFDHLQDSFPNSPITTVLHLLHGVKYRGIDRSEQDILDPASRGKVIWDEEFDLSSQEAQEFLQETCRQLREFDESIAQFADSVYCFVDDYIDFVANETSYDWPVPAGDFLTSIQNYTAAEYIKRSAGSLGGPPVLLVNGYQASVRFDPPEQNSQPPLRYVDILANMTYTISAPASKVRPGITQLDEFIAKRNQEAKDAGLPGMTNGFVTSEKFLNVATEEVLVTIATLSMVLSLAFVAVVIYISTSFSAPIAAMATTSVAGSVLTFVAFMITAGWELGIIESINMTISVGLSVDYIVHFANAYVESKAVATSDHTADGALVPGQALTLVQAGRFLRVQQALAEMGISVFSSGITTMGSAAFLLLTQVLFFSRFGVFLLLIILFSWLFAFGFFYAMCSEWGPINKAGGSKVEEMKDINVVA